MSWFKELFINEARPAIKRYSGIGSGSGSDDDTQMYILVDEDGDEYHAVFVEEETVFNATANDIREGMIAATDTGVVVGTKEIPAYITTEGVQIIQSGEPMLIKMKKGKHMYTKLLGAVCSYNTTLANSTAVEKSCINDKVYPVNSVEPVSSVTVNDAAEAIDLGIMNESSKLALIRYFTYKEEH